MEVQGVGSWLVIRRDDAEEKTAGGILIPDSAKEKLKRGTIVSLGDYAGEDHGLAPGDRVIFKSFEGFEMKVDGKWLLFIEGKHIAAKFKEPVAK